jgi:hypothetical protein
MELIREGISLHIIIITNYRKKLFLSLSVIGLWVIMFLLSSFLLNNSFILKVTINNKLTFSYPLSYEVEDIFINESAGNSAVEANWQFKKPVPHKFSDFLSQDGRFSFSYPDSYELSQQYFAGSEILYHIDFHDKSDAVHGFVQVWNMSYDLKDFLNTSKSNSQADYKSFDMKSISVNGNPGYLWDYSLYTKDGSAYKGMEVFFKKENLMYRISYFVPEKAWDKAKLKVFWNIVNSFKTF